MPLLGKKRVEFDVLSRAMRKAKQSPSNFRIAAAAYSKNGNLLGLRTNSFSATVALRRGCSRHAEARLIKEFGRGIDTIYLVRISKDFNRLPIHPCENCAKLAAKYGIKIVPMHIEFGYKPTADYP